ncbi:MAG: restriction endonuclease subunit S [Synergistaceae bacterium]|nr:restriction endonuclease subunit S [Synergistaceae bacterium]
MDCERAVFNSNKIICILANTNNNKIKVWKSAVDDAHLLKGETVLDSAAHYFDIFEVKKQNDRELVLKNTYDLNKMLHKMGINENERSQFVGTSLLYLQALVKQSAANAINQELLNALKARWSSFSPNMIRNDIADVLNNLLDDSDNNKATKIALLQRAVLDDQKIKMLNTAEWIEILETILMNIYKYINTESSEGQDILNLFFIAFNKYVSKDDKNQAFTPDHITDLMCRAVDVDRTKVVMDICCGSGSFLVQAMVKELADCRRNKTGSEAQALMDKVKKKHIYGIELVEKVYGLSTTNMLIHGDGNSNIKLGSCFDNAEFIKQANPDIVLMNPPYNAIPKGIPDKYKINWGSAKDGKEDPTKGFVFIHFLSDVIKDMNNAREQRGESVKTVKLAVLLPVSAAIGSSSIIKSEKEYMLADNTLEAVFTLPNEVFYPGASVSARCMIFTLGKPHVNPDGTVNKTFFGYFKDDGFKKKKNLGRIEQFDWIDGRKISRWKQIEERWLTMFKDRQQVDGLSAVAAVTAADEWLCEAYMKTDYSKLSSSDFQAALNNYMAYLIKQGKIYETKDTAPLKLNTQSWKEFRVGDIFNVELSKGDIQADDVDDGNVLLISSGSDNNGVVKYIDAAGDGKAEIFSGNKISVDMFGNTYYQAEPFYAVSHGRVNILTAKFKLNKYIGLFISTLINQEQFKYSYGRAVYSNVASNMIIKLPVTASGEPDWQFMENYIKSLHCEPITTRNAHNIPPQLNTQSWKEFRVGDIFNVTGSTTTPLEELEYIGEGRSPYVTTSAVDNGVAGFYNISTERGNVICIESACAAYATYQADDFSASDHVEKCIPKFDLNIYTAMFLVSVLNLEQYKYSYGRKCNQIRIRNRIIKLPADKRGEPDWQFMEDYIKSLPYGDRL